MTTLNEAWEIQEKTATAFNEVAVLETMGEDGWEMTGFGAAALHFRRPENAGLHRTWEYKRVSGLLTNVGRGGIEKQSWSFLGN